MIEHRALCLFIIAIFPYNIIVADSLLATNNKSRFDQATSMKNKSNLFFKIDTKRKYKKLSDTFLDWAILISIPVVGIIVLLIYWYNRRSSRRNPNTELTYETVDDDSSDKTPVPLPYNEIHKNKWDITAYSIWKSSIIKKNSPIVLLGCVKKSYYSYGIYDDVFNKLDLSTTLFVNAANPQLRFGGLPSTTNGLLSARIRDEETTIPTNLHDRANWGDIEDINGTTWNKNKLSVGEFVISKHDRAELDIAHLLAPQSRNQGMDKLRKGVKNLCDYAYRKEYSVLILAAVGTGVYANNNVDIGNAAYQAIIGGVEDFLKEQGNRPVEFEIYLNWWDARIVQHVPFAA
ncbi:MAG: hypothetical protein AAF770_00780 [Bacteroidota bacterium]